MHIARLPLQIVGLIASALLLAMSLFVLLWQADAAKQWVIHTTNVQFLTEQLLGTLRDAETGQRGFLLTNDASYLAPYENGLNEGPRKLAQLRDVTADNVAQQDRLKTIQSLMSTKFTELSETIARQRAGDSSGALDLVRHTDAKSAMDNIRTVAASMLDTEAQFLIQRQARANWLITVALGACVAITAVLAGLAISAVRHFADQVAQLESLVADRTHHLNVVTVELAHRSKNQLALVQSIANQTARYSPTMPDFLAKFGARLQALGRSVSELTRQEWRSASLHSLMAAELEWLPATITHDRVAIEGPDVLLTPTASHYIGLALHELLTNAVKHGALSNASGRVALVWTLEDSKAESFLQLTWVESGGPQLTSVPMRTGFGSVILTKLTAAALKGDATIEFGSAGLKWSLLAPAPTIALMIELPVSAASAAMRRQAAA